MRAVYILCWLVSLTAIIAAGTIVLVAIGQPPFTDPAWWIVFIPTVWFAYRNGKFWGNILEKETS